MDTASQTTPQSILPEGFPPAVRIRDLKNHIGQEVSLQGWLYNMRSKGKLAFLQVRDGSGICQCVAFQGDLPPEVFEAAKSATQETALVVRGAPNPGHHYHQKSEQVWFVGWHAAVLPFLLP